MNGVKPSTCWIVVVLLAAGLVGLAGRWAGRAGPAAMAESPATSTAPATAPQAPATQPSQPASQAAMRRVHVFVSGRVQGVGFRDFTVAKAKSLGVTGWVRNLPDGRVEAVAEAPADKVAGLVDAIRTGPAAARVDDVKVEEERYAGEFASFSRR